MAKPSRTERKAKVKAADPELKALRQQVANLAAQVRALNDQAAIRDVLRRYARGLDRHDVELETSAFWPEGQVNYGFYSGQRDDFVEWGNDTHQANYVRHEHHITTQTIDIDRDVAHVESYVIFFLRSRDEASTHIGGARYIDRMERRGGEWRISVREFLPDIMIAANSIYAGDFARLMSPPSGEGTWDRNDLSYLRPLEPRPGPSTGQGVTKMPELPPPGSS